MSNLINPEEIEQILSTQKFNTYRNLILDVLNQKVISPPELYYSVFTSVIHRPDMYKVGFGIGTYENDGESNLRSTDIGFQSNEDTSYQEIGRNFLITYYPTDPNKFFLIDTLKKNIKTYSRDRNIVEKIFRRGILVSLYKVITNSFQYENYWLEWKELLEKEYLSDSSLTAHLDTLSVYQENRRDVCKCILYWTYTDDKYELEIPISFGNDMSFKRKHFYKLFRDIELIWENYKFDILHDLKLLVFEPKKVIATTVRLRCL